MYMGPHDGSRLMFNSDFRSTKKEDKQEKIRTVLHCDANSFFASCETMLNPKLAETPMAVCGSVEDRHGIVLAKNQLAKKFGVKTGEAIWQAKKKCPILNIVRPTYGLYTEISQKMNKIFYDYTDLVEPFGIDESWLDVTGSYKLFGSGKDIADSIRARIKNELGITASVGVSFNKVFAKLGSDMKKPDATTVIPYENFHSTVWPLPVGDLLFIGPACAETLCGAGIFTIGDLACSDLDYIRDTFGKNGIMLRDFALGRDYSEVAVAGYETRPKSVSNGMTFRRNLVTESDISFAMTWLSNSVAARLRKHSLCCNTVSVTIKNPDRTVLSHREQLSHPSCLYGDISKAAIGIINEIKNPEKEIYAVTVHAEKLTVDDGVGDQQQVYSSERDKRYSRRRSLEETLDRVRARYGSNSLRIASAYATDLI